MFTIELNTTQEVVSSASQNAEIPFIMGLSFLVFLGAGLLWSIFKMTIPHIVESITGEEDWDERDGAHWIIMFLSTFIGLSGTTFLVCAYIYPYLGFLGAIFLLICSLLLMLFASFVLEICILGIYYFIIKPILWIFGY